jgi:CRISPR-associated protein Csh2
MSGNNNFNNRVFGLVIIKAINSNFNADFSHQPRTLPDGRVYATDKVLKYSVRHYLKQQYPDEKILYYKRLKPEGNPLSLAEAYDAVTSAGSFDNDYEDKPKILANILECLDVRLFGSTFAAKKGKKGSEKTVNLSVHGPAQINHGINQFYRDGQPVDEIYSEQIMSPFRSDSEKKGDDSTEGKEAEQSTLGRQSKLREGHYAFHFSLNPKNLQPLVDMVNKNEKDKIIGLRAGDAYKLKEALRCGVTHFDSSAKAGSDNELLLWVQLKEDDKKVLPSFTEMVKVTHENGKVLIDLTDASQLLKKVPDATIELYYLPETTTLKGAPEKAQKKHLLTGENIS